MNRMGLKVATLGGLLCLAPAPPLIHADAEAAKAELLALHRQTAERTSTTMWMR